MQITALSLGVVLIGIYFAARIHGSVTSRRAVEQFDNARSIEVEKIRQDISTRGLSPSGPVDTTLWAGGRIEAYQQSLLVETDLPLAVLRIPRINLEVPVFEGTDELTLNRGAGHIEGTALPGMDGNFGVAAHRDGFFRELGDVAKGDPIIVDSIDASFSYLVDDIHIVDPTDVWVLEATEPSSITLVTCYPFYFVGSAPQRYIVKATLQETADSAVR